MTRSDKAKIIENLSSEFASANAIVVSEFKGLNVAKLEILRNSAREQGVKVQVVKNTLANIALQKADKNGFEFKDTNIFVWGEDGLVVSKVVAKFEEKNELFQIKSAFIDGEITSADKVRALSKMPSREELIAMLLQVWNAPLQNFVIGLNALKEKKEQ